MRKSGILLHISSLPSEYGIGKMGMHAYKFIDYLEKCRMNLWQILPLSPTSYGDSPYQSFSAFAGNPYFIDFDILNQKGLLAKNEYTKIDWEHDSGKSVDYAFLYKNVYDVLRCAFKRFKPDQKYKLFEFTTREWIYDYALFMAIKDKNDGLPWYEWPLPLAMADPDALDMADKSLSEEIAFHKFVQYCFYEQWTSLKNYANSKGIQIIGDIPIYVSYDSVEAWRSPELFMLDEKKSPIAVAGCPPDVFSPTGQLWGNPLYNWDYHIRTDFAWWIQRLKNATELYDIVRIDHFRGFESFYCIPYGNETAEAGIWQRGPNADLFIKAESILGKKLNIIAEDLGFITDEVKRMLEKTGYPGMKVLEFAFSDFQNGYFPHNFTTTNCYAYTGTHDNDTIVGWYKSLDKRTLKLCKEYLNVRESKEIPKEMIRCLWSSIAENAVVPFQDLIEAGSSARMNTPSTHEGNWCYRTSEADFTKDLSDRILMLNILYNRGSKPSPKKRKE